MRTETIIAALVLAVSASAIPEAEPLKAKGSWHGWCAVPGYYCTSKREATPHEVGACGTPGNPCHGIKQAAHGISDVLYQAGRKDSKNYCNVDGAPCDKASVHINKIAEKAREAYSDLYAREADAVAEAAPLKAKGGWHGWCAVPGYYCTSKRDADANQRIGCQNDKFCPTGDREHDREALAAHRGRIGVAGEPGTPWLVSRSAEAAPLKAKGGWHGWCAVPGYYCTSKRSVETHPTRPFCAPGAPCVSAHDAQTIAGIIHANDPSFLKKQCQEAGNECDTLQNIKKVFQAIHNDVKVGNKQKESAEKGLERCEKGDSKCSILAMKHATDKHNGHPAALKGEDDCNRGNGYCGAVRRDLEELEAMVDEAIAEE
ncbi:hypothetical protein LTR09_005822 [Extremus antarcticus]|uniref:Clock-controlled pheromone ccg-4 n=1 Tax=Extremus antarcticus TaxID=702011 RepID=A0AAJ0GDM6_9PEZI|nr:hypothetical protein LTR09_005822 [Extremus antarcticus]